MRHHNGEIHMHDVPTILCVTVFSSEILAKNRFLQASVEISKALYLLWAIPELILRTFTGVALSKIKLWFAVKEKTVWDSH